MTVDRTGPKFDEEFWLAVHRRAERVRELVVEEIDAAERMVFSDAEASEDAAAAGHNVVPVFTEPFWEEVESRAHRVRSLAAESLAAAEARLVGDDTVPVTTISHRPTSRRTPTLRNLGRSLNLQRSDAFGFVAALLAAILLVPQLIAPVWSNAGVEPPKIIKIMLIGDKNRAEQRASEAEREQGSAEATQSSDGSSDRPAPPDSESSGGPSAGEAGTAGTSPTGEEGTKGTPGQGTPGPNQSGTPGAVVAASPTPASSPSPPAPPPTPPAAPLDVKAVAVRHDAIRISWTDASADETAFLIERLVPDGAPASVQRVGKDASRLLWDNLTPETRTCFRVRSLGEGGRSEWAPSAAPGYVCATTLAAPADTPGQSGGPAAPPLQPPPSPVAPPA